jgi:hypothetical protein
VRAGGTQLERNALRPGSLGLSLLGLGGRGLGSREEPSATSRHVYHCAVRKRYEEVVLAHILDSRPLRRQPCH